jgi:hypothetical protein
MKHLSPSPLTNRVLALAEAFARDLLAAVQRGSLRDLLAVAETPAPVAARATHAPTRRAAEAVKPRKRRARSANRTPAEIARLVDRIARAVADAAPHALSGGELRTHLGVSASAFARPIREAVHGGRIATQGKGRLTEYVVAKHASQRKPTRAARRKSSDRAPATAAEAAPDDDAPPTAHEATDTDD